MSTISVSICIPAYNEEQNIGNILKGLLRQKTKLVKVNKICVVTSGCTDSTTAIVSKVAKRISNVILLRQKKREGKASAINEFLKKFHDPIVVVQSADTIPQDDTIEKLCSPLVNDQSVGMTGGAPFPVNDPNNLVGYIIHTWWWFHRHIPRFGEIIAFRNILDRISTHTAVDEAFIQAKMIQKGYNVVHVDEAVVRNKGPETIGDLVKQRRRIFNGHARLFEREKIKIDDMTKSTFKLLMFEYQIHSFKELIWLLYGMGIEIYAQFLGAYDMVISKRNPVKWDISNTTKNLKQEG